MKTKQFIIIFFLAITFSCDNDNKTQNAYSFQHSGLEGSWKVHEIHYKYADTVYKAIGEPYGRFLFTKNQYSLMYNPSMNPRTPFKNLSKPEPDEVASAFGSMVFNSGSYTYEDSVIKTIADAAKVPGFEGGNQYYKVYKEDENMRLTFFDETYPDGNKPEWYGDLEIEFFLKKEVRKVKE